MFFICYSGATAETHLFLDEKFKQSGSSAKCSEVSRNKTFRRRNEVNSVFNQY